VSGYRLELWQWAKLGDPGPAILGRLAMTPSPSPHDESLPLTRRDVLRIGAASASVPLIALTPAQAVAGRGPAPADAEAAPAVDVPPLPGEDHAEARAKTIDNLKLMGLAMQWFAVVNDGRFPPAALRKDGKALLSWRVALLPFVDQLALYKRFHLDEPWDSDHNKTLLQEMPNIYAPVVGNHAAPHATYYQTFIGPGALFDGEEGARLADVFDGVGSTLMIVEAAQPVAWTKPEEIPYDPTRPLPKIGGQFEDGAYVAFADGSARFLSSKVAPAVLRALITRASGEVVTFDMLGPWRRVS
jgi:hypothetical protein